MIRSENSGQAVPVTATGGFRNAAVLTPHDSNNESFEFQSIYVGGTGNITVVLQDDTTVLFSAVPVGTILPIAGKRVNATGTTATLMVGIY